MEIKKSQYIKKVFYTFVALLIFYGILRVNIDTFRRLCAEEKTDNIEINEHIVEK